MGEAPLYHWLGAALLEATGRAANGADRLPEPPRGARLAALMSSAAWFEPRPHCYRCDRPEHACLCAHVRPVDNQTPVVIVQHKHESRHPFGTVRIAELGLARVRVHTVPGSAVSDAALPDFVPAGAGLLYPGPGATPLEGLPEAARPAALVLVDGTWHQARALLRDHAWLRELPRYGLSPTAPSRYRIRREPALECLSTLEAIVQSLALLEPELEGMGQLLAAFDRMIDGQLELQAVHGRTQRERERRPRALRYLPRALVERFDDLVLVYGEASRSEHEHAGAPELVHWTALRLNDLATFDRVLCPRAGPPSPVRLAQLELDARDFEQATPPSELARAFSGFVPRNAWFAAWNPRTLAHYERVTGQPLAGVGLKGVVGRLRGLDPELDRSATLEHALELPPAPAAALSRVRGRAGRRLTTGLGCALSLRRFAGL